MKKLFDALRLALSISKVNFKLRNEGSYLGILWYLLEPISFFLILLSMQNMFSSRESQNYSVYLLTGLITFNFFKSTTQQATGIFNQNGEMIKSIRVPLESLVMGMVFQSTFSHIFEVSAVLIVLVLTSNTLWGLLLYPFAFVLLFMFVTGVSFILAVIGVYVNDLGNVWSIFTLLLWFMTPIFYTPVPGTALTEITQYNPMYYLITLSRDFIITVSLPKASTAIMSVAFSLGFLAVGWLSFQKVKHRIPEMV